MMFYIEVKTRCDADENSSDGFKTLQSNGIDQRTKYFAIQKRVM